MAFFGVWVAFWGPTFSVVNIAFLGVQSAFLFTTKSFSGTSPELTAGLLTIIFAGLGAIGRCFVDSTSLRGSVTNLCVAGAARGSPFVGTLLSIATYVFLDVTPGLSV